MKFKDPSGKAQDQLLLATSEGIMRVVDDKLVPALPSAHALDNQTYLAIQSRKNPDRVFIGHGNGVGSMRWDGGRWVDEGRLPNTVYVSALTGRGFRRGSLGGWRQGSPPAH